MSLGKVFSDFACRLVWDDIPGPVRTMATELLADWLANAAAGSGSELSKSLASFGVQCGEKNFSLLAGSLQLADPLTVSMVNGAASHALEFDDSHREGLYHPGGPVISAAWAAAGIAPASGRELLTAIIAGYEISIRLAQAINPAHYTIWHTTGTIGTLGAAVAAARCLELSPQQTAWALGLAGTQAAGLWEVLPESPEAKALHPAKAAHGGLLSAMLAQRNIAGPSSIFEGSRGLFAAMARQTVDVDLLGADLGENWRILETTFKAYPVCGHTMTALEAAIKLHGKFSLREVSAIEVRVVPVSIQIAGNRLPESVYQAKFSLPFCVIQGLRVGRVTQAEFHPDELEHPEVRILLQKVKLVADEEMGTGDGRRAARVTVKLLGGRSHTEESLIRKGDPERPLSAVEKKEKFYQLLTEVWGRDTTASVYGLLQELPKVESIRKWWISLPQPDRVDGGERILEKDNNERQQ
jgi:2-methylcitrate dehydratase PrpD